MMLPEVNVTRDPNYITIRRLVFKQLFKDGTNFKIKPGRRAVEVVDMIDAAMIQHAETMVVQDNDFLSVMEWQKERPETLVNIIMYGGREIRHVLTTTDTIFAKIKNARQRRRDVTMQCPQFDDDPTEPPT
jgi:hypothetical protein